MITAAKWIAESWAEELKAVLQFLTGEDWTADTSDVEPASSVGNCYWWLQKYTAAPGASIAIGAQAMAWSELGARILQAAGVELIEQASARSTYLEAVQQAASGVTRSLASRLGRPVEAVGGQEDGPPSDGSTFGVVMASGDFHLPPLRVHVSDELFSAFAPPALPAPASSPTTAPVGVQSRTMSVLLDVRMPVSISFGRASMQLRDVMKLAAGSAVELDRRPDDEVDVIVNDCVIARGEVVVMEGNYGVRITQIVSREQRLALRAEGRL